MFAFSIGICKTECKITSYNERDTYCNKQIPDEFQKQIIKGIYLDFCFWTGIKISVNREFHKLIIFLNELT